MNETAEPPIDSLVYPYHIGPGIREFTTALLYHGQLTVSIPGWISDAPLKHFYRVGDCAAEQSHSLEAVFSTVRHFLELAQKHAINRQNGLEPLAPWLTTAQLAYPGTREQYAKWIPHHENALPIASAALTKPENMKVAATEFIWRVYELALELDGDPDHILDELEVASERLGESSLLLAECFLNRLGVAQRFPSFVIDSPFSLALLNALEPQSPDELRGPEGMNVLVEQTSFTIFDRVLEHYTPALDPPNAEQINQILEQREEQIVRMREKCTRAARDLILDTNDWDLVSERLADALDDFKEEASSIARLDESRWKRLRSNLLSDSGAWLTLAGVTSTAAGSSVLSGSVALTALAALGASAFRTREEFQRALDESPWAIVYYLERAK